MILLLILSLADMGPVPSLNPSLQFLPNRGELDAEVRYFARLPHQTLYVTEKGLAFKLSAPMLSGPVLSSPVLSSPVLSSPVPGEPTSIHDPSTLPVRRQWNLFLTFEGQEEGVTFEPTEPRSVVIHHCRGERETWATHRVAYRSVLARGVYPGIDIRYYELDGHLEYDLICAPDADLSRVRVRIDGARELVLTDEGTLEARTDLGPLTHKAPRTFIRTDDGDLEEIPSGYHRVDETGFGFWVSPPSSHGGDIIVDPGVLYSTYMGDVGDEEAQGMIQDAAGNTYVIGWTNSIAFPTTPGAYDETPNGTYDAFVSKFDAQNQLVFSTFLGGTHLDVGTALITDNQGSIYLTGYTASPDFPTTAGAYDRVHSGGGLFGIDAFIARLDAAGGQLLFSSFLGGTVDETALDIEFAPDGGLIVCGWTDSPDFPTTPGAFDETYSGLQDGYIAKFNATASQLQFSTLLGGFEEDEIWDLVPDTDGSLWATGRTYSHNFPITPGVYDDTWNGSFDVIVLKLNATGDDLEFSTFIGGMRRDEGKAIVVDDQGIMYVTGIARSPNFPVTHGAYDETLSGHYDAFVASVVPDGSDVIACTYLGGESIDDPQDLTIDSDGDIYVTGFTWSEEFPVTLGTFDDSFNGVIDVFLSKLDNSLSTLLYSTYMGGPRDDQGWEVVIEPSGTVCVVGSTRGEFPVTPDAYDPTWGGELDVFITKLEAISDEPASWQNYGQGWPGTLGIPSFGLSALPQLCTSLTAELENSAGIPTLVALMVGFAPDSRATPWGGTLLVIPSSVLTLNIRAGVTSLSFDLPCDEDFLGQELYLQALENDQGASGGVSFTPGLKMVLGG